MKCKQCSSEVEVTESNFHINKFNILITCNHCNHTMLENEIDNIEELYWESDNNEKDNM